MATYFSNAFTPKDGYWRRVRGYWQHVWNSPPWAWHGIDWGLKTGSKVHATHSAIVSKVVLNDYYAGNNILLQVTATTGKPINMYLWYAHLSKVYVKNGQRLKGGALIGLSGATGRVSGPHLHFSWLVRVVGVLRPRDPENRKAIVWRGKWPPNFPY